MSKVMWLKLTPDEYSLIEAVADSSRKLSKMCGVSHKTIESAVFRYRHGMTKHPEFMRIEVDE